MRRPVRVLLTVAVLIVMVSTIYIFPAEAQAPEGEAYIVQPGDTLSKIAEQFYGSSQAYQTIVDATNARSADDSSFSPLTDSNVISTGQKLWIPLQFVESPAFLDPGIPRWETVTCSTFDIPRGLIDGVCGYVTVPEFHENPEGEQIRIAVLLARKSGPRILGDRSQLFDDVPLFVARGGPGKSAFDLLPAIIEKDSGFQPILLTRDIVFIEQRGTRYSIPYLSCPETFGFDETGEDPDEICRSRWEAAGVDLNAYDSLENAADVVMVADTLGYEQFNIYGESYGSLLAQFVMREYPERVRSAILDAVVPPNVDFQSNAPLAGSHALRQLFASCEDDAECSTRFPNLEQVFLDLLDDLTQDPITLQVRMRNDDTVVKEIDIDGERFAEHILDLLYNKEIVRYLPRLIYRTATGDYEWMTPSAPVRAPEPDIARAMTAAVNCSHNDYPNQLPFFDPAYPQLELTAYDGDILCTLYGVEPLPADTYKPVTSSIPTLILNGQFDPITPPQYGEYVGSKLEKAFVFTYAGEGHGVLIKNICVGLTAARFLVDPENEPRDICATLSSADFPIPNDVVI